MAAAAPTLLGIDLREVEADADHFDLRHSLTCTRYSPFRAPLGEYYGEYLDVTMHWSDGRAQRG